MHVHNGNTYTQPSGIRTCAAWKQVFHVVSCCLVLCSVLYSWRRVFQRVGEEVVMRPMSQISVRLRAVCRCWRTPQHVWICQCCGLRSTSLTQPTSCVFIIVDIMLWVETIEFTKMSAAQQWDTRVCQIAQLFALDYESVLMETMKPFKNAAKRYQRGRPCISRN